MLQKDNWHCYPATRALAVINWKSKIEAEKIAHFLTGHHSVNQTFLSFWRHSDHHPARQHKAPSSNELNEALK